jgi:hypothetical protein
VVCCKAEAVHSLLGLSEHKQAVGDAGNGCVYDCECGLFGPFEVRLGKEL